MTDMEYCAAYKNVAGEYKNRESDTTENQKRWLWDHVGPGRMLLEIGPGKGAFNDRLVLSHKVTTLDLFSSGSNLLFIQ